MTLPFLTGSRLGLRSGCVMCRRFRSDESGATLVEYGVIAGLIVVALLTTVATIGNQMSNIYTKVSNAVGNGIH